MATTMPRNGPNDTKNIRTNRRYMHRTTHPNTYMPNVQQGGYLSRKLQKIWKKELSTYHIIKKTIKLTTQNTHW
jgi:hypothetical protein